MINFPRYWPGNFPASLFLLVAFLPGFGAAAAEDVSRPAKNYPFSVLNQRSITLTAEYWNPILRYISARAGVPLTLRIARTAHETTDMAIKDEIAFVYTNHFFTPERDKLGFTVLARQEGDPIRGQIVVASNSPTQSIKELENQEIAFANPYAFTGYFVPMDQLLREGVKVKPNFPGNQEAAMGQLKTGRVAAAGVNSKVMADYAKREKFTYKVLWESMPYLDLAVMAHPSVPTPIRNKIRNALISMKADPEGYAILTLSAKVLSMSQPQGFSPASDADYDNYRIFFKTTRVPQETP